MTNLAHWLDAYNNRASTKVVIAGIGDSIMEGVGADDGNYSFLHRIAKRTSSGVLQPASFLPITHLLTTNPWTITATNQDTYWHGIGRRTRNFQLGHYAETTFVGDRFTVHYVKDLFHGSGHIVRLDGNIIGTFDSGAGTYQDGYIWDSGPLAYGLHTVRITANGDLKLSGIKAFSGDFSVGIQVYAGGRSGATMTEWRYPGYTADNDMWPAAYAAINPDLIVVNLISNDYWNQGDPAETQSSAEWIISTMRTVCAPDPSFLFVIVPPRNDVTPAVGKEYSDYVNAIETAAAGDPEVEVFNLTGLMPGSSDNLYWGDGIHPTTAGHELMADLIMAELGISDVVKQTPRLTWDRPQDRLFIAGVDRGVLYLSDRSGVAWNGLIGVDPNENESIEEVYFDGQKVLDQVILDQFTASIKAYTYPDEFLEYEGLSSESAGLYVDDQSSNVFSLAYRSMVGDDLNGLAGSYQIHILYNLTALPKVSTSLTISSSVSVSEFQWDVAGLPERLSGNVPTNHVILDSRYLRASQLAAVENELYGTVSTQPTLPTLSDLYSLIINA